MDIIVGALFYLPRDVNGRYMFSVCFSNVSDVHICQRPVTLKAPLCLRLVIGRAGVPESAQESL